MLKIKEFREKKGLTQQELADILGIHKMTLSKYERNKNFPEYDKLVKIAIILEVTPNDLLGYKENYKSFTDYLMSLKEPSNKA